MRHARRLAACLLALAAPAAAQDPALGDLLAGTHVHGLAFDPETPGRVLLATHHGLWSLDLETLAVAEVAEEAADFMGFSPVPNTPGTFLASGHPPEGGNLGVQRSTDGGATWEPLSPGAGGPVDFHQMAVSAADPALVWGIHHGAVLQRSRDGGATWEAVGPAPEGVIDLAASASAPETLHAATETGLRTSTDGGATWAPAHPTEVPATVVDVGPDGRTLTFLLGEGLLALEPGASGWTTLGQGFGAAVPLHLAQEPGGTGRILAATADGRLMESGDSGRSWTTLAVPAR